MTIAHELPSHSWPEDLPAPERIVIVVDRALGAGHAANAAAVLALTLGARRPELPGPDIVDGDGRAIPGLYPAGLPVLGADGDSLRELRRRAVATADVGVIVFPAAGQQTTDYDAFRTVVSGAGSDELGLCGLLVGGPAKVVRKLTGSFGLLR